MNAALLKALLRPVIRRQRRLVLWLRLVVVWLAGAGILLAGLAVMRWAGFGWRHWVPFVVSTTVVAAFLVVVRQWRRRVDLVAVAGRIEARHPDLNGLVLTAVQQEPPEGRPLSYLQERLIDRAVQQGRPTRWREVVPASRVLAAQMLHWAAVAALAWVAWTARVPTGVKRSSWLARLFPAVEKGLTIVPGDAEVERGESLVFMARFGDRLPDKAELVIGASADSARRIPMVRSLGDPVYGTTLPDVQEGFTYRIESPGSSTRPYKISVFEYPRLERADAELTYPAYTRLEPRRIEDTRRITAAQGTRVDLALQLNKPVAQARLAARGDSQASVPLAVFTNKPAAEIRGWTPASSRVFDLILVDAEGRTNKAPTSFVVEVQTNRTPEIRIASPRGDTRPSPLEEVAFQGTVWDDHGIVAHGLGFAVRDGETRYIQLGTNVAGGETRAFQYALHLEDWGVKPDELVSWFGWADDLDADGQVRRTSTDIYFGEIRPFVQVFREGQGGGGGGESGGGDQRQGNELNQLADLQKKVIAATWKLHADGRARVTPQYAKDVLVVRDSQEQVREKAAEVSAKPGGQTVQALWNSALQAMDDSIARLNEATNAAPALAKALVSERAAQDALLKLRNHETSVARQRSQRNQNGPGGEGDAHFQRELDQLDLTQNEDRYETKRLAKTPESGERREQLQILNRLQELARRQQDVTERLRELQTSLQEARSEQEREAIRRQLKRLKEEQQRQLADVDELRQRMESGENQSRLGAERQQLENVRREMQRAADAAEGSTGQAVASGTRAQRQLQEMRDALRKQSSSEFSEELREMRNDARDMARREEEISRKLDALANGRQKQLEVTAEREQLARDLVAQKSRMTNLVDRATRLSSQAEASEPLLSRQLYDTLRKLSQDDQKIVKDFREELMRRGMLTESLSEHLQSTLERDNAKTLEMAAELVRRSLLKPADAAQQKAREVLEQLKLGVEKAAERVIGDDAEALRQAQNELDAATDQLQKELAAEVGAAPQAGVTPGTPAPAGSGQPPSSGSPGQQGKPESAASGATRDTTIPEVVGASESAGAGQGRAGQPGRPGDRRRPGGQRGGGRSPGGQAQGGQGGRAGLDLDSVLGGQTARESSGRGGTGPITGEQFAPWSDRLRDIEELVDQPALRDQVATARERARQMRVEFKRDMKKPDWAVVRLQIIKPLVEVRDQIREDLARRESREALVPIDRDPVPRKYADVVRRYYEDLGKAR